MNSHRETPVLLYVLKFSFQWILLTKILIIMDGIKNKLTSSANKDNADK